MFPGHERVGGRRWKRLLFGGQTGGSANKKKNSTLKIQIQSLVMDINSCPTIVGKMLVWRPRSALAEQGGGDGGRGERREKEREKGYIESRVK